MIVNGAQGHSAGSIRRQPVSGGIGAELSVTGQKTGAAE